MALLLPGQGAQYPGMGLGLYRGDAVFGGAVDEALDGFGAVGDAVRRDWCDTKPTAGPSVIDDVTRAQPLLFAIDYALGKVVLGWGVPVQAVLGHSVGELAAATLAGVFSLADATHILADRVARIVRGPAGGMVAVAATRSEVEAALDLLPRRNDNRHPDDRRAGNGHAGSEHASLEDGDRSGARGQLAGEGALPDVVIAATNGPRQTVIAGPTAPLATALARLRAGGWACRTMPASSPFHSPALAATCDGAARVVATTRRRRTRIALFSGFTGGALDDSTAADPTFWAGHPSAPVLFAAALDQLLSGPAQVLLEAGPGQGLALLARRHPAVADGPGVVHSLLGHRPRPADDPDASVDLELAALQRVRDAVTGSSPTPGAAPAPSPNPSLTERTSP